MLSRRQPIYLTTFNLPLSSVFRKFFKVFFQNLFAFPLWLIPCGSFVCFLSSARIYYHFLLPFVNSFSSLFANYFFFFRKPFFPMFSDVFRLAVMPGKVYIALVRHSATYCARPAEVTLQAVSGIEKSAVFDARDACTRKRIARRFPGGRYKSIGSRIFAYSSSSQ